ncbi:MAG: nucleoside 2-deoxyribosyltransferase [Candidatus Doudnabacteria bacterium]|nr:nucleoside 2-deoxyribosyltransferase [Candidatus Doudnabacteria bacterium]
MKIYFCGSITGGRQDAEVYSELIKHLQKHGSVLTEHVGQKGLTMTGQVGINGITAEDVYEKDVNLLKESDLVVAEVTTPSLGVGYELGLAESLGKKVLCLYRVKEGKKASAMILGNKNFVCKEYAGLAEAYKLMDSFLS